MAQALPAKSARKRAIAHQADAPGGFDARVVAELVERLAGCNVLRVCVGRIQIGPEML